MPMSTTCFATPIGPVTVESDGMELVAIRMGGQPNPVPSTDPLLAETMSQIGDWFAGRRTDFDLPLAPANSPRGNELRAAICAIPYGEVESYGEVARHAGSGPRAIGQACRRNPFPIVVPCHRVIGAGQAIGHYSGGEGIVTKRWLLAHEQAVLGTIEGEKHG